MTQSEPKQRKEGIRCGKHRKNGQTCDHLILSKDDLAVVCPDQRCRQPHTVFELLRRLIKEGYLSQEQIVSELTQWKEENQMELWKKAVESIREAQQTRKMLSEERYPEEVIREELVKRGLYLNTKVYCQGSVIYYVDSLVPEEYLPIEGFEPKSFLKFHLGDPGRHCSFRWDAKAYDNLKKVAGKYDFSISSLPRKGFICGQASISYGLVDTNRKVKAVVIAPDGYPYVKNIWLALDYKRGGELLEDLVRTVFPDIQISDEVKSFTNDEWWKMWQR